MTEFGVSVALSGPMFDGSASRVLFAFEQDATEQIAQAAHQQLHRQFGMSFKNPTGFYRSRTVTDLRGDHAVVHDSNVIYGNWIEGTSQRNQETRFKGYHSYRKVTQNIEKLAPAMAERILSGYLRRLS